MNPKKAAKKIEKMGQKGDTILAHINEEEAQLLKARGGAGKRHPKTGLLQFYDGSSEYGGGDFSGYEGADFSGSSGGTDYGPGLDGMGGDFGTAATEVRGFTPGVDMQSRNFFGQMLDRFQGMSPGQQMALNVAAPGVAGLGMFGNYLDRNFGLGWSGGSMGGQASAGNGFDGGNLPGDNATTPTAPTTPGTGTAPGLPITPPNWGNYGPSPFTFKFGKPRNNAGLLGG